MFFALFSFCSSAKEKHFFICDFLRSAFKTGIDPLRPFDGALSYFDRTFYYSKAGKKLYTANFSYRGELLDLRLSKNVLSSAYLTTAREQQGFYREIFDVYRFNIKTNVLIHSYVYYVHPKDYSKNFNSSDFVPYNQPLLFDLINRPAPESYRKIGWDKTAWQCYSLSFFKYLFFRLKELLSLLTAG